VWGPASAPALFCLDCVWIVSGAYTQNGGVSDIWLGLSGDPADREKWENQSTFQSTLSQLPAQTNSKDPRHLYM